MLKFVLLFGFFIGFNQLIAQNQAGKQTEPNNSATQTQKSNWPAAEKPYVTPPINENDPYMGRTEEFLFVMTVDKLPADFPKYDKSMGLRLYNNLIDNYYEQHLDLLKDKWKQKILQSRQAHTN